MKKSYLVFLSMICGAQIIAAPSSALAFVYRYDPGVSSVETDPTVLDTPPSEPVPEQQAANPNATTPAVPVEQVDPLPLQKKLPQPFFTTTALPAPEQPAVTAPTALTAAAPKATVAQAAIPVIDVPPAPVPVAAKPATPAPAVVETKPAAPAPVVAAAPAVTPPAASVVAAPAAPVVAKSAAPQVPPLFDSKAVIAPAATDVKEVAATPPAPVADTTKTASLTPAEAQSPVPQADVAAPAPQDDAAAKATVPTMSDLTLGFDSTSSTLSSDAQSKLDALTKQLKDAPDMRLQIRGYAKGDDSGSSARRLSLSRALMVRSYLIDKDIKAVRLDVRALGTETDTTPVDRVDLVFVR